MGKQSARDQKRDIRRADRARAETLADQQVHGSYTPPDRGQCTKRSFYLPLDDDGTIQVSVLVWSDSRQMVDFHLVAERLQLVGGNWEWTEMVGVDICHGHAHAHLLVGKHVDDPPTHIKRIDAVEDVQRAYTVACTVVLDLARRIQ